MMSHPECVGVCEKAEDDSPDKCTTSVSNGCSSPDRQRVLKEVGLTSTTFIGPAFPPPQTTTVKSDLEDTLSEFYKELEKIDTPDGADDTKQDAIPPETSTSEEPRGASEERTETDHYQRSSGHKQHSWPHWYQNEPYYPRRPRPDVDPSSGRAASPQHQWHYPQTLNRPPPRHSPPPTAFQGPRNPPSHANHSWRGSGMTNQHREESHLPTFYRFPPPSVCSHPSQGFNEGSPKNFDRDERGGSYDAYSDHVNVAWSRDRERAREEWCQLGEDYDRRQRYDSQSKTWEHYYQSADNNNAYHSSLVLILMRGLPGSGKSTLARELLSTGPSGLILSTDDFFAHRDGYRYEAGLLHAAHEWNQRRAKDAMDDGRSPIIIDNTNIQAWEMKPYVQMAVDRGYKVDFCEPDTTWKFDPRELEKRNKHGVHQEKIAQMMDRFSLPISIDIVMSSQEPLHVNQRHLPEQPRRMMRRRDFY
ncbi:NEDD4-binding protein 2-like 2 Phosphonoformate immuno-associated protein 5 [Larimichthys crocea]|uniref:NEDD4-binding protein 2-like 2 Phosphonoformate immuno-associated protein 5 n=1 Tax=Larimichthys crocea TaxID=215358 RepID=A0A6G0IU76_LARCR|nr:NEDD4-binding protein 2-like 2 Phosphonoformate immuno-associated protein 5 [Larimichthys crocea]